MYENYTRQSLPSKEYRELLGTALCVFNSNNAFIIENIIRTDSSFDWYELNSKTSGHLDDDICNTITQVCGNDTIGKLFSEIVKMRNKIVHSYQITSNDGEQILATAKPFQKNGDDKFIITKDDLMNFIKKNEELCDLLHDYRGH